MPKCTIAIPVFNRERFIAGCVASALAGDFADLEVLVVDNQSTDGTWEILQGLHDPRLRLERNATNLGMFGNFNRALRLARGEYLGFLCSDDRVTPEFLSAAVALMEQHPNVAVCSGRGRRVNETGGLVGWAGRGFGAGVYPGPWAVGEILRFHAATAWNPLNYPSGVLLRRSAALAAGEFNAAFVGIADVDFMLRALKHGDLAITDTVTCEVTVHPAQAGRTHEVRLSEIGDFLRVAEAWRPLLEARRLYWPIRRHHGGFALLLAALTRLRGERRMAAAYRELSERAGGGGWVRRAISAGLVALRHLRVSWGNGASVQPPVVGTPETMKDE